MERKQLTHRAESAEGALAMLKSRLEESESRAQSVQSELDDLLLVLGELEEKQTRYKEKIKSLGGQITDDEDE
jgi:intracellular protein transport protein USO1